MYIGYDIDDNISWVGSIYEVSVWAVFYDDGPAKDLYDECRFADEWHNTVECIEICVSGTFYDAAESPECTGKSNPTSQPAGWSYRFLFDTDADLTDSENDFKAILNSASFNSATEGFTFASTQNFALGVTENLIFGNNFSVLGWIYPDFTTVTTDKQTIF
jgi:hypothetical protein